MADVTQVLLTIEQGDPRAAAQLLPLVYQELRRLAAENMAQEAPDHTLQATALVHEAYLRLVGTANGSSWNSRGHFFAAAAEAMRRILVDQARRKARPKHGGDRRRISLDEVSAGEDDPEDKLLSLNEALEKLEAEAPLKAELIKLRYFAGLSHQDAAQALGISRATADRYWAYARTFLYAEIEDAAKS